MKQQEIMGFETLSQLDPILKSFHAKNVFLVTGKQSFQSSGAKDYISKLKDSYSFIQFQDFQQNPQLEDVNNGIELYHQQSIDVSLAIGGGSVIDMAKLITSLAPQPESPEKYIQENLSFQKKPIPLVAIPTTAGSGSEATHFAVVYIDKIKYSLADKNILPSVSIVDPNLTLGLPPSITASSGMDALCQAIESYWSIHSTPESKKYASKAIKLVLEYLQTTFISPKPEGRFGLAQAAHLAGKAINFTKTTAAHAFSYPFTTYFGIPHGHAVSLSIGELLLFNSKVSDEDLNDPRGIQYVQDTLKALYGLLGAKNETSAKDVITDLMSSLNLMSSLGDLNIDLNTNWERINKHINIDRLKNNPRAFTQTSLRKFFEQIS